MKRSDLRDLKRHTGIYDMRSLNASELIVDCTDNCSVLYMYFISKYFEI